MPGTTPEGAPYPLPSEPVRDGAVAIRNLAEWVSPRTPRKTMVVNGNYVTDAQGYFSITVPGTTVAAAVLMYIGTFGPIICNGYNVGGPGIGFKLWSLPSGNPVASTTVPLVGIILYS